MNTIDFDKDGNEIAEVTASDFVNSAYYVCDAVNAAAGASQYTNIVAGSSGADVKLVQPSNILS